MLKFLRSNLFFFILLTLVVFIVYGKSINYEFTKLDDDGLTSKKSLYISNIKNFPKFFLTDCYHNKKVTQYYRPVLSLSFAIETILFGVNLKVYHLINIILFILTLYLMYLFLCKLNSNKTILKFVILIFSVHPVFVSTVVWLPARNDTLLAVFLFLFLITYINYINENKKIHFVLSNIFFIIALFTKETTIIILPIMILLVYCFNLKTTKKQVLNYLVVFVPVLILYFCLRQIAVYPINLIHYINHAYEYFFNIVYGLTLYIKYVFICDDVPIMLNDLKFDIVSFCVNITCFVLLVYVFLFRFFSRKIMVFCFMFYILFLLPTFAQEWYTWLPHRLIIPLISIVFVFTELVDKLILKHNILKKYFIIVFVVLFGSFAFSSYLQSNKYKNYRIYWSIAYNDSPTNKLVLDNISNFYIDSKDYDKAKDLIFRILKNGNEIIYYLKLISIEYAINKDSDIAEKNYLECLKLNPPSFYKAIILAKLSEIYYMRDNDLNKAMEYIKKALEIQPYNKDFLVLLAGYYALNKQFKEARPIYERLLRDDPKNECYQYFIKTLDEDEKENG